MAVADWLMPGGETEPALLPASRGTYVLILRLPVAARLEIGRLGTFDFPAGWYAYAGSACGPGGLRGRLAHHLRPLRRPHWHVDYLRALAPIETIWWSVGDAAQEHAWAAALGRMPGAQVAAPRFGASDCRCPTHLYYFAAPPELQVFSFQFPVSSGQYFTLLFSASLRLCVRRRISPLSSANLCVLRATASRLL